MNELKVLNEVQTIPSYEVAKMMGREHKEVLKMLEGQKRKDGSFKHVGIIPTLTSGQFTLSDYFIESTYTDKKGEERKCYECTKLGCDMLANKMTGEKGILFTARYVKVFNEMAEQIQEMIKPSYQIEDPIERAKRWIQEQEEKKKLEEQNKLMQPKAEYHDRVLTSQGCMTVTQIAKDYGISAVRLNNILKELGVQYKVNGQWVLNQEYCGKGYVESDTYVDDKGNSHLSTKWTQVGREFIDEMIKEII